MLNSTLFKRSVKPLKLACLLALSSFSAASTTPSNDIPLPELGDSISGYSSPHAEKVRGRAFLAYIRGAAPLDYDPLINSYSEHLLYKLASNSELKEKQLQLVIIDNPSINAFAAPGGIIGVNNGLFLNVDTEGQLAAVLSHEIAHLSQRHYARQKQLSEQQQLPLAAAILASIVLMASGGGEAGIAAAHASIAGITDSKLRFSRAHEQEADRIGLLTLVKSGYPAAAVSQVFEKMLAASRLYGSRSLEFLYTHPLTESRIADGRSQAANYPSFKEDLSRQQSFLLTQARVSALTKSQQSNYQVFKQRLNKQPDNIATQYGYAVAAIADLRLSEAAPIVEQLITLAPHNIYFTLLKSDWLVGHKRFDEAAKLLDDAQNLNPGNYPIGMAQAEAHLKSGDVLAARKTLMELAKTQSDKPNVWYLLAETQGLAGDIAGVHEARAEYFIMIGALEDARKQLEYAIKLRANDPHSIQLNKLRLTEVAELRAIFEQL